MLGIVRMCTVSHASFATQMTLNEKAMFISVYHWLCPVPLEKGVHQFRYFLPLMRSPNHIVVCSCIYTFVLKWAPMRTSPAIGVRIGAHFNTNEYTYEQTTIGFGVRISSRKYLNCCTPFSGVRQWYHPPPHLVNKQFLPMGDPLVPLDTSPPLPLPSLPGSQGKCPGEALNDLLQFDYSCIIQVQLAWIASYIQRENPAVLIDAFYKSILFNDYSMAVWLKSS